MRGFSQRPARNRSTASGTAAARKLPRSFGRFSSVGETSETSVPSGSCEKPTSPGSEPAAHAHDDVGGEREAPQGPAPLLALPDEEPRLQVDGRETSGRRRDQHRPAGHDHRAVRDGFVDREVPQPLARVRIQAVHLTERVGHHDGIGRERRSAREEHRPIEPGGPSLGPVGCIERADRAVREPHHDRPARDRGGRREEGLAAHLVVPARGAVGRIERHEVRTRRPVSLDGRDDGPVGHGEGRREEPAGVRGPSDRSRGDVERVHRAGVVAEDTRCLRRR